MRSNLSHIAAICISMLIAILFCASASAELNWSTEKPEGRCLTRTQYSYRWSVPPYSQDWCDWFDMDLSYYADYPGYEVRTRTLYAASDGVFVLNTADAITMLQGTGAQMAFPVDIYDYYWRTTNKSVASVDQSGYVSAHQAGSATIEVYLNRPNSKTPEFTVDVTVIPSAGLKLPSGTAAIAEQAFCGDEAVSSVDLRGTRIEAIEGKAFADTSLELLLSDGGNVSVDDTAFDGDNHVTFAVTALGSIYDYAMESGRPCYLIGEEKPAEFIPVSSIETGGSYTFQAGESNRVTGHALPLYADNTALYWYSSAPDIVSVGDDNTLNALRAGTADITLFATDGSEVQATFTVTVIQKVTGITLNHTNLTMQKGDEVQLIGTVYPSDATDQRINFTSDNSDVAYIYGSNILHAQGPGTTVIRGTARDGSGVEAICTVTVSSYGDQAQYTSIGSSDVTTSSAKITAQVQLSSGVNPSTFGYYLGTSSYGMTKRETESSSGLSYVIENIFYTCAGLSPSTTYYYRFFMNYDGQEYLSNIGSFTTAAASSTTITGSSREYYVNINQDIPLQYTVSPSNASIAWSSSDAGLCSVDQSGKIYPRKKGQVTITATATANGSTGTYSWIVHII